MCITTKAFLKNLKTSKPDEFEKYNVLSRSISAAKEFTKLTLISMNIEHLSLDKYVDNLNNFKHFALLDVFSEEKEPLHFLVLFQHLPNIDSLFIDNRNFEFQKHILIYKNLELDVDDIPIQRSGLSNLTKIHITGILNGKIYQYFNIIFNSCCNLQEFEFGGPEFINDAKMMEYLHEKIFRKKSRKQNDFRNLKIMKLYGVNFRKMYSFFDTLEKLNLPNLKVLELYGNESTFLKPTNSRKRDNVTTESQLNLFKLFCQKINNNLKHFTINTCDPKMFNIITNELTNLEKICITNITKQYNDLIDFTKLTRLPNLKHVTLICSEPTKKLTKLFCSKKYKFWLSNLESLTLANIFETDLKFKKFCKNCKTIKSLKLFNFRIINCTPIFRYLKKLKSLQIEFNDFIEPEIKDYVLSLKHDKNLMDKFLAYSILRFKNKKININTNKITPCFNPSYLHSIKDIQDIWNGNLNE